MGSALGCFHRAECEEAHSDIEDIMDEDSGVVWRHELTLPEARKCFETDGTVPVGCSDDMLELRMYISDPSLLRGLVSFAKGGNDRRFRGNVMLLRRWVEFMAFKYINDGATDLKISTGYDLYFKFLEKSAGIRRIHCDPDLVQRIERELRDAAVFNGKYLAGLNGKSSDVGILRSSLFDEIYFADMETILNSIYLPLKATPGHQESLSRFKTQYNKIHVHDFEYYEALGHGGFGCVVHCKKKSTGVHYAMKIQTKDGVINHSDGDFARVPIEKEALVLCNHPFITNLIYAFQNEQLIMMVMSLAAGSLSDFAKEVEGGVLSEEHVLFYAAEVLLALNHIHRLGMIYRDMKPGNILLMEDGHVKLADLGGVADVGTTVSGYHTQAHDGLFAAVDSETRDPERSQSRSAAHSQVSQSHASGSSSDQGQSTINSDARPSGSKEHTYTMAAAPTSKAVRKAYSYFGTAGYVAPEVVRTLVASDDADADKKAKRGYSHAVDFFSLGVTMYRLLTAQFPFEFRTTQMENFDRSFIYRPFPEKPDGGHVASEACRDLLEKLLVGEEKKRLGYGRNGFSRIKKHPVFAGMSWIMLAQKKLTPPDLPAQLRRNIESHGRLYHDPYSGEQRKFEGFYHMLIAMGHTAWVTKSLMTAEEQVHFRSWDYVSPEALGLEIMHANGTQMDQPSPSADRDDGGKGTKSFFSNLMRGRIAHDAAAVAPASLQSSNAYSASLRSLNLSDHEVDSYMSSVQMVDAAAQVLRTIEVNDPGRDGDDFNNFDTDEC